jgi:hypothetical protein
LFWQEGLIHIRPKVFPADGIFNVKPHYEIELHSSPHADDDIHDGQAAVPDSRQDD